MNANADDHRPSTQNEEESHLTKGLIRLTMACNEKCPFCNVPQEDYAQPTPPVDDVMNQVNKFIDRGDRTLTISGGEPTLLKKRLLDLAQRASDGGIEFIEIQTNAVLIDGSYATDLRNAGVTSAFVSLLSHQAEHHDQLAGLKGAFERCLRGIDALLDAGIRVALNPVTARATQELLPDYVDFVATRLPRVKSISVSAVQPHGRAAHNLDILPDYSLLSNSVKSAQKRAQHHDISLLNPYCGLPLCVGWSERLDTSVEAIEATAPHNPQGVDNHGNKRHGEPCQPCGLRSRCGGAWHAIWDHRGGSGIAPPWVVNPPWTPARNPSQETIDLRFEPDLKGLENLKAPSVPVRWLWTHEIPSRSIPQIRNAAITHIALDLDSLPTRATLAAVRRLIRANQLVSPQRRIQVYIRISKDLITLTAKQAADLILLLEALGITSLDLPHPGPHLSRLKMSYLYAPHRPHPSP